ncbi:MAG: hypothetical protein VZS44_02780 [Bacilli bacterium]|nr:hypothetical protein [Bacilli bacterium]
MVKYMKINIGKIVKYNSITGCIRLFTNNEEIFFHEKDLIDRNVRLNNEVEFNVEKLQNGDKVARNIKELKK